MQDFRDLKVWQRAHEATLAVYRATSTFPREELYGLTSQLRRSAASVAANIAEGRCRGSDAEFARFLQIALGSASETQYHLILAHDLGYVGDTSFEPLFQLSDDVKRMLTSLIQKLKADS